MRGSDEALGMVGLLLRPQAGVVGIGYWAFPPHAGVIWQVARSVCQRPGR